MYIFIHSPRPILIDNVLDPPYDKNGSGTPTTGNSPEIMPILILI